MPEIGTFGLMSGDGKRSVGHRPQATAPILDSTFTDKRTASLFVAYWDNNGQRVARALTKYAAFDPSRTSCSVGLPIAVDRLRGFNPRDAKDRPGHVPDSVAHRNLLRVTNPPRS